MNKNELQLKTKKSAKINIKIINFKRICRNKYIIIMSQLELCDNILKISSQKEKRKRIWAL